LFDATKAVIEDLEVNGVEKTAQPIKSKATVPQKWAELSKYVLVKDVATETKQVRGNKRRDTASTMKI
jgi:hypothetical protein